jgi:diketogulonate reductase-like aldo/keto reductase
MQYLKMNNGLPIPVLNQFLSYPGKHNQALIDFCKANAIISEAYQFIKKVSEPKKTLLIQMAQPYGKTWLQVILNYQIHQGLVVIPKSHHPKHLQENIDVFDFTLIKQDIKIIQTLNDHL